MEEEDNIVMAIIKLVGYILVIVSVIAIVVLVSSWRPDMIDQLADLAFLRWAFNFL